MLAMTPCLGAYWFGYLLTREAYVLIRSSYAICLALVLFVIVNIFFGTAGTCRCKGTFKLGEGK